MFIRGFDKIPFEELLHKVSFYKEPQSTVSYQARVRSHFNEFHSSFESIKPNQC